MLSQRPRAAFRGASLLLVLLALVSALSAVVLGYPTHFFIPAIAFADSALCLSGPDTTISYSGTVEYPDSIKAAIVWVAFSDSSDSGYDPCHESHTVLPDTLPNWFRRLETELEKYVDWQSYGKMYLDARTVQHSGADSLKPWNLEKTPCYWIRAFADPQIGCPLSGPYSAEGCVNRLVINSIENELGDGYFSQNGFNRVLFIHMGSDFSNTSVAGWGDIGYSCMGCPYSGSGTTQRPILGDTSGDDGSTMWLLGHEFGHTIGLFHTPRSGHTDGFVYMGRYDAMQNGAPLPIVFTDSFAPYHLWQLTSNTPAGPGWFESAWFDTIRTNTLDVRIYDVRNPNHRNIALVDTRINTYDSEFWLIHHQNSVFDEIYGGDRLAIWHMRNPDGGTTQDFDLELATGKFQTCSSTTPNASSGVDSLECKTHQGTVRDLYAESVGPDSLNARANPNTNDYSSPSYPGTQTVWTGISIHDIRLDYPTPFMGGGNRPLSEDPKDYWVDVVYESNQSTESPFLYTWNGKAFPREVNLLSGLGFRGPGEVGGDHIVLREPQSFDAGKYVFKIREDGHSTTYLDRFELQVVDHEPGVSVVTDREGSLVAYSTAIAPGQVTGLPGDPRAALAERGELLHGDPGAVVTLRWEGLLSPTGAGGVVVSAVGRAEDDMPANGGVILEVPDGQGGWSEIRHVLPRSALTDVFLSDAELRRVGGQLDIRIRWLDFHALDYIAYVTRADPSLWSAATIPPDSAVIAYGGPRLEQLLNRDGSFAVLPPGSKLTVAFPFTAPESGRMQSVVVALDGYYEFPPEGRESPPNNGKLISYLDRSHPNPFNPSTHISFALNRGSRVSLDIYSVRGTLIRRIYEGPLESGSHDFVWDGRSGKGDAVSSGVYFYELRAGSEVATGKMLAVK